MQSRIMAWLLLPMTWMLAVLHGTRLEMGPCHRGIQAIGLQGHRAPDQSMVQIRTTTSHEGLMKTSTMQATGMSQGGRRQRGALARHLPQTPPPRATTMIRSRLRKLKSAKQTVGIPTRLSSWKEPNWKRQEKCSLICFDGNSVTSMQSSATDQLLLVLEPYDTNCSNLLGKTYRTWPPRDSMESICKNGPHSSTEPLMPTTPAAEQLHPATKRKDPQLESFSQWGSQAAQRTEDGRAATTTKKQAGYGPDQPDRYAGILCMLSSKAFAIPSVREVAPGRLLQIQAQHIASKRTVTLIGVYQHVHRPHLGAQKNKEIRGQVWHKLQQLVGATPARHMMLVAGDFNSTLQPEHPYVGPAAPSRQSHSNYDSAFQALVRGHRLTAANTWHSRPSHTFTAPGVQSQIDYVIVRLQDANRVMSTSSLQQQPPSPDLCAEHEAVNIILQEETCKFFPPIGRKDCRVSAQPEFRASASATWELHRRFRRSGLLLVRNIFDRLKHYTAFLRASKALRSQSMALKKQFLQDRIAQAEQAACQGDQRALFQVARQLAPRSHRGTIRLQDPAGKILGSSAAMEAIVACGNATFAARPDSIPQLPQQGTLGLGSHTFSTALSKLNVRKAVPGHCAPAASWRLCSSCISDRLGPLLARHFSAGSTAQLVGDLKDAHVMWLEKPGKPPVTVGALRPIGLMPPCAKVIAADLAQQIQAHLQPLLDHMPQYAYSPNRGCSDAILRVHQHFEQVEQLHQSQATGQTITICGIKQGCRAAPTLWLSLTLSIMETLIHRRSLAWLHRCLTAFADDLCSCWRITSSSDLLRAISDLELILEILAQFRLTVNLQKTALLMNVRGKEARKILAERIVHKQGVPHLRIQVNGHSVQCTVLHQLCLATIFCQRSSPAQASQPERASQQEQPQKRQRPDQNTRFQGRRRPFGPSNGYHYNAQHPAPAQMPMDPTMRLMSKLLLKHEAALSGLRQDKNYVLFFRQDEHSLLPNLMQISKEWHDKRAAGDMSLKSPLKTVLMGCLLKELLARLQRVASTEQGRASLQKAQWIQENGSWNYVKWNPKERRLVPDESKEPLTHAEATRILSTLHEQMSGTIIQHFQSTQPLWKLSEQGHQQATFQLEIALRGENAEDTWLHFRTLCGLAVTNLAGFSMKVDDLPRQHLAKELASLTYVGGPMLNTTLWSLQTLFCRVLRILDQSALNQYGDAWVTAHMSIMNYQIKELEVQMQLMQRHLDKVQLELHSMQLLIHRHAYLYSNRRVNKIRYDLVRDLHSLDD
ncbi:GIP [Symbiodinium sp. CCMP2592]|nr:GIP [Symbiodinium sp. CCMP2592]